MAVYQKKGFIVKNSILQMFDPQTFQWSRLSKAEVYGKVLQINATEVYVIQQESIKIHMKTG